MKKTAQTPPEHIRRNVEILNVHFDFDFDFELLNFDQPNEIFSNDFETL